MKEVACQFGEQNRLNGIITRPRHVDTSLPVLVLISAGFTPKQGPYRLYAQLARRMAEAGVTTLRFDLGGIGNSEQIHPGYPLKVRTRLDITEAVDYLEKTLGSKRFVLCGLCSGAEDSFRYAEVDRRVIGVILMDPHAYKTLRWRVHKIFSRYFFNLLVIKVLRTLRLYPRPTPRRGAEVEGEGRLINFQYMDKEESSRILAMLLERQIKVHYIYTRGQIKLINHRRQFFKMFEPLKIKKDAITLTLVPHIEHVQVFEEDRRELIRTIFDWFMKTFSESTTHTTH